MITKCMDCGTVLRTTNELPIGAISHGYCPQCAEAVIDAISEGRKEVPKT